MHHKEMCWKAFDGLDLYAQVWEPDSEAKAPVKALVLLVHGLGEHSGRYAHVARALTGAGYTVLASDLRGHGQSGGPRGHSPSGEAFLKDMDVLFAEGERLYPQQKRFLYGHSLGGALVLYYALQRKPAVEGVISTAPGLRSPLLEQKLKLGLAKTLASLAPTMTLTTGLDADLLCHDAQVIQRYKADPLVHDKSTCAMAAGTINAIQWTDAHAEQFPLPLLLMHGTADEITFAEGSRQFAGRVKTPVTLKLWDGLKHELHNEPEQAAVIQAIIDWMDARLA